MPEYQLLVRVRDKVHPTDRNLDALLMKRGDVIHIAGPNHQWGLRELDSPDWIIIRATLNRDQVESLVASELVSDPRTQIARKRGLHLDLDSLGYTQHTRQQATAIDMRPANIAAATKVKPVRERSDVIGKSDLSIG